MPSFEWKPLIGLNFDTKTRVFVAAHGEDFSLYTVLIELKGVTDRQTDRQTERHTDRHRDDG